MSTDRGAPVELTFALSEEEAWGLAQFVKRADFGTYLGKAQDREQAYSMQRAGERLRTALADAGYAPR